ncbi:ornithine cyclodeaminase [Nocardioides humi]|uniref:Ornithine cyclodeaminase n=2 Tax=Nocardioides humi TaxID=449461 RepID=A0ABN2BQW4_9ACTN
MDVAFLSAAALAERTSVDDAIEALEGFLLGGFDPDDDPARTGADVPAGQILLMPAAFGDLAGVKLVSIAPANPECDLPLVQAVYVLLDGGTLTPLATLDGTYLTTFRTSAVSALAARRLARPDSGRLALFGAGVQAWAHARSLSEVLPLRHVDVVGRRRDRVDALVARIRDELGIEAASADAGAVARADVVACCTTAREPLFDGRLLRPGTAVVAIGAYQPDARELDDATLAGASVVVESRGSALREAGDVIQAIRSGAITTDDLICLRELVLGEAGPAEDAVRVFKGTGMSWQDLAVAGLLHRRASG